MHDLNFFEGYLDKRKFKFNNRLIYIITFGILILALSGYIAYNFYLINEEQGQVNALKVQAEDSDVVSKVEEIKEKEEELASLEEAIGKIKTLDTKIEEEMKIDDIFLEEINASIPNDIFLTSISVDDKQISIVGISKDKWAIPEFQNNLEYLEEYDEIFVPYITLEDDQYNFALDLTKLDIIEEEEVVEENTEEGVDEDEGTNEE